MAQLSMQSEILDMIAGKWLVKSNVALSLEMGQRTYRKLRIYKCQTQEGSIKMSQEVKTCLIAWMLWCKWYNLKDHRRGAGGRDGHARWAVVTQWLVWLRQGDAGLVLDLPCSRIISQACKASTDLRCVAEMGRTHCWWRSSSFCCQYKSWAWVKTLLWDWKSFWGCWREKSLGHTACAECLAAGALHLACGGVQEWLSKASTGPGAWTWSNELLQQQRSPPAYLAPHCPGAFSCLLRWCVALSCSKVSCCRREGSSTREESHICGYAGVSQSKAAEVL